MKLEVGMYVRTEYSICKYLGIDEEGIYRRTLKSDNKNITTGFDIDRVLKASFNIIDLIEAGDYVNGMLVCKNEEENYLYLNGLDADGNYYEDSIRDIKTVVTREQFEYMEYRIGE